MTKGERLKVLRLNFQMTQEEVGNRIGVTKQTINKYENGTITNIPSDKLEALAHLFNTTVKAIWGWEDKESQAENIVSIKTQKVPLIGTIAAGVPIYTNQEFEYVQFNGEKKIDFCLKVKGDSMVNARINDGDLVFCRTQETVENGEIAAVVIDDTATLKRFYFNNGIIQLVPENPKYAPLVYTESDYKQVRVLGKAIAFQSLI